MRRARRIIAAMSALSALEAPTFASATTTMRTTLNEGLRRASIVFAGSVSRATPVRMAGTIATRYVFTNLKYAKGSGPADSISLTAVGGELGGEGSLGEVRFTEGSRYVVLATAVSARAESAGGYWPLDVSGGPFLVAADSGRSAPVVHGFQGWPLVAFREYLLVLRNSRSWAPGSFALDRSGRVVPSRPPDLSPWTWASRDTTEPWWEREAGAKVAASEARNPRHIRTEVIWRQRDLGTRVTEAEFLDQIRAIVRERAKADSSGTRPPAGQVRDATPVSPGPPAQEATPPQPPVREHSGPGGK